MGWTIGSSFFDWNADIGLNIRLRMK